MVNQVQTRHEMVLSVDAAKMLRDLQKAEKEVADLAQQFDRAQAAGKKFQTVAANTNRSLRNNGRFAQQAGVQFGDFLVQVGGGQNALLAFGQQANQMASFMAGPWGIGFTVATGLLAAFAGKLGKSSEEADELRKKLEAAEKATADLVRETERLRSGDSREVQNLREIIAAEQERLRINEAQERTTTNTLRLNSERIEILRTIRQAEADLAAQFNAEEEARAVNDLLEAREGLLNGFFGIYGSIAGRLDEIWKGEKAITDELSKRLGIAYEYAGLIRAASEAEKAMGLDAFGGYGDWRYDLPQTIRPPAPDTGTSTGGGGATGGDVVDDVQRVIDALERAQKQADQFGQSLDVALGGVASSALDDFVDGLVTGELAFKDFARSVLNDLAKIMVRAIIVNSLMSAFGGVPGNPTNTVQSIIQGLAGVQRFGKGGVVSGPTLFPMSGGAGLMGEAGPEAIVPLRRDGNGDLGVGASPVVIHNYTGAQVQVEDREGERHVIIGQALEAVKNDFSKSMASGQGTFARALEAGYGTRRKAT
ncbi:phage tail tape measure protein [Shimia aestuarii]|uniref:Phage tail tape measure protein, lambda family n=1 Tax=Shimia aestuarii TaxID=254406 RepID=A0A1I4P1T9_9RHOB|nr:phage tail tape measure protein, lambda family [Shimia aestuarii]